MSRPLMPMPTKPTAPHLALRFLPALACMAAIFAISHQPKLPEVPSVSGELVSVLGHLAVYFALAVLIWWALGAFAIPGWRSSAAGARPSRA